MPIHSHILSIQDVYKEIGSKKIKLQFISDEPKKNPKKINITNIGNIRRTNNEINNSYISQFQPPSVHNWRRIRVQPFGYTFENNRQNNTLLNEIQNNLMPVPTDSEVD